MAGVTRKCKPLGAKTGRYLWNNGTEEPNRLAAFCMMMSQPIEENEAPALDAAPPAPQLSHNSRSPRINPTYLAEAGFDLERAVKPDAFIIQHNIAALGGDSWKVLGSGQEGIWCLRDTGK